MKTKVYAVAETVPEDCDYITAGKLYATADVYAGLFDIEDDEGDVITAIWAGCEHLDGGNWTRLELPDIDPRDVAALIEAAEWAADVLGMCAQAEHETDAHDNLVTILNKIKGDE